MKKNDEETSKEVINKIVWRLKSTPTVSEVKDLLDAGILSKDEAREILFKVETEEVADPATYNDLKKEIEFLRGLILNVMSNARTETIVKYIESNPYRGYPWIRPYITMASSLPAGGVVGTSWSSLPNDSGNMMLTLSKTSANNSSEYPGINGIKINAVSKLADANFDGSSDSNTRYLG